jgi:RNA polymerase sigma factor (sigma-70 family)
MTGPTTSCLQRCLDRLNAGDPKARDELLRHSQERLRVLAHRMLARFPAVRRWEETDDVLQQLLLDLEQALERLTLGSVRDYLRLAAANLRHVLIDLARHYGGPLGLGANHATPPPRQGGSRPPAVAEEALACESDPEQLAAWGEFHELVGRLPDDEREVFDLLWYQGLSQGEAAALLHVSLSTVKRRWQAARIRVMEVLDAQNAF